MVSSELCGDPKIDPHEQTDPRWTPALAVAAGLRRQFDAALDRIDVLSHYSKELGEIRAALHLSNTDPVTALERIGALQELRAAGEALRAAIDDPRSVCTSGSLGGPLMDAMERWDYVAEERP